MDSLTVNGLGQYRNHFNASDAFASFQEVFTIPKELKRLKLRNIHAGLEFQLRFVRLYGLAMTITASDGVNIIPVT